MEIERNEEVHKKINIIEYSDEEEEFISNSDIIKNLMKETGNWVEPKFKPKKKRESKE